MTIRLMYAVDRDRALQETFRDASVVVAAAAVDTILNTWKSLSQQVKHDMQTTRYTANAVEYQ